MLNISPQVYLLKMLLKSRWAGIMGTEGEDVLFVLWRRLITKLLTLLVNLINLITVEESPDYTQKSPIANYG